MVSIWARASPSPEASNDRRLLLKTIATEGGELDRLRRSPEFGDDGYRAIESFEAAPEAGRGKSGRGKP